MFSPHEGGPATATRSRRRQRPVSTDSLAQQPKAKRQRLPLTEQTFVNPDAPPEMFQVKADKAAMLSSKPDGIENSTPAPLPLPQFLQTAPRKELSVRSKKSKAGERTSKGDGSVVLASNSAYAVSKLPALPDRLRTDMGAYQHGSIYAASGYAMSLTHTHAVVWPYSANTPSPETFTFALPYPSRHASDPLPLGALVAPSASSEEPGLVVVMPVSGKVSYWESISSAATLDFLRQQRTGVEDVVPGVSSTEYVAEIINAEPAGFVLVTSSGRMACMNLRDAHGRPAISVQFLRRSGGGGSGAASGASSFFGSLRHALKHSANREDAVVAVRAGPVCRVGERTVMAANARGRFSAWKMHRGGSYDSILDVDAREPLLAAIRQCDASVDAAVADSLELLDFTFVPRGIEKKYANAVRLSNFTDATEGGSSSSSSARHQLLLLVTLPRHTRTPYYLVELILAADGAPSTAPQVGMVRPLMSLTLPSLSLSATGHQTQQRPRVYLPRPAVVAYVVFGKAVAIISLAQPPETPDSQLQGEIRQLLPATFEDIIDLRNDDLSEIVGSGIEEPASLSGTVIGDASFGSFNTNGDANGDAGLSDHQQQQQQQQQLLVDSRLHRHKSVKNPAAVLLVRGVGMVRVATLDVDRFVGERPPEVTAKSKLEEAVFFGIKEDNPLAFEGRRPPAFSDEEIGEAAMILSREILGSKTSFTPKVPASVENNLRQRAAYLVRLMAHLRALRVQLSRRVRWRLLWDAEKMAAATSMWLLHEQFLAERATDSKVATATAAERKTIVSEIVEYIHEDEKKTANRDVGEVDAVRHFFVNDVWRMDLFVAWAYEVIKYVYKDHLLDDRGVTRLLFEGVEVNFRALQGAATYREEHLGEYGLADEVLSSGILEDGSAYAGLPEPWTSTYFITNNAKRLVDLCCSWLDQYFPHASSSSSSSSSTNTKSGPAPEAMDAPLIEAIREALPGLTDRYLVALQEHARWTQTREAESERQYGELCAKTYAEDRYSKVYRLKNYGLWEDAMAVAQKHESVTALAEIMVEEVRKLRSDALTVDAGTGRAAEKRASAAVKEHRIGEYFGTYGRPFAFAVYNILLRDDGIKAVLDFPEDRLGYATQFLRSKPELAKISWINDVERERDVDAAAGTLLSLGLDREQLLWNKKIELSLGKLALLAEGVGAGDSESQGADGDLLGRRGSGHDFSAPLASLSSLASPESSDGTTTAAQTSKVDQQLAIIKIQDRVYRWVQPSIMAAVDEAAELQLAMENHGGRIPRRQRALLQVLEDGMARLLRHEALDALTLIDVLTLMDNVGGSSSSGGNSSSALTNSDAVQDDVFALSLQVAQGGLARTDERLQAQRLIWRRCFLRDDWSQINNTQLQDDEATAAVLSQTAAYRTAYALGIQRHERQRNSLPVVSTPLPMLRPSEVLGAYTDMSDATTAERYANMEDGFREKLLDVMRHEDALLRRYMDKSRLEEWSRAAAEGAEKALEMEMSQLLAW